SPSRRAHQRKGRGEAAVKPPPRETPGPLSALVAAALSPCPRLRARGNLGGGRVSKRLALQGIVKLGTGRRRMRQKPIIAWLVVALCAVIGFAAPAKALDKVKVVIPQNSVFILNYMAGKDAGIFSKHGIDIDIDARPFAGFLAGLPSKATMAVTYSGMDAILKMNQGVDWVI